jgi:alpha-tubulin suppressor-like RCC1 family protein
MDESGLNAPPALRELSAGAEHTCGLTTDGRALCWGQGAGGRLGTGEEVDEPMPRGMNLPVGRRLLQLAAGADHTCARADDGTLHCAGANARGQLGNGSTDPSTSLLQAVQPGGWTGGLALSAGAQAACAVDPRAGLWCWGSDDQERLGNSTLEDALAPGGAAFDPTYYTLAPPAVGVALGGGHTCALTAAGGLACAGADGAGQLGRGITGPDEDMFAPVVEGLAPAGTLWLQVSAGDAHTCALALGGELYCWGEGGQGQLGTGGMSDASAPAHVVPKPGSGRFVEVSCGAAHTCARTSRGRVFCWGPNDRGQLAAGSLMESLAPHEVMVDLLPAGDGRLFTRVRAGGRHTCALTVDGHASCWGADDSGQLGNGALSGDQARPSPVDPSPL